jgi:hypothetical protein
VIWLPRNLSFKRLSAWATTSSTSLLPLLRQSIYSRLAKPTRKSSFWQSPIGFPSSMA